MRRGMFLLLVCCSLLSIGFLGAQTAQPAPAAQPAGNDFLKISLVGQLVLTQTDAQGVLRETLAPLPALVQPGALIQYEITAFNKSTGCPCTDTLKNVAILGAVPTGTSYIDGSASKVGAPLAFSIDGGKTYMPAPVIYKVKLADGSEVDKIATPDMYTGLKWVLDSLIPQQAFKLLYRVRVLNK